MTERRKQTYIVSVRFVRKKTKSKLTVNFDPPIEYDPMSYLYPDWRVRGVLFEEDGAYFDENGKIVRSKEQSP